MPRPGVTFRPRVETLEAREVPYAATLTWIGGVNSDFFEPQNWEEEPGVTWTLPLNEGCDLIFDGSRSSANCYGMDGLPTPGRGGADFPTISFVNGYSGTVTMVGEVTVEGFWMSCGSLYQATGTDLIVQTHLDWTGGTLNSSSNLADVTVTGGTALIDPAGAALSTASTLSVINNAALTLVSGTLNFTGGSGMYIDARVDFKQTTNVGVYVANVGGANPKQVEVAAGNGDLRFVKLDPTIIGMITSDLPILNNGSVHLQTGIRLTVNGNIGGANGPSLKQESGTFVWGTGADIATASGMTMAGGTLRILGYVDHNRAYLMQGNLTFTGGTLRFSGDYARLVVEQNVTWSGGTYTPRIDGATPTDGRDVWIANGTFKIGANATLAPDIVNQANANSGDDWIILMGNQGITDLNGNATTPLALPAGMANDFVNGWASVTPAPKKGWWIKKT